MNMNKIAINLYSYLYCPKEITKTSNQFYWNFLFEK